MRLGSMFGTVKYVRTSRDSQGPGPVVCMDPTDTPSAGNEWLPSHRNPVCGALRSWPGWLRVPSFPAWRGIVPENRQAADTSSWQGSESFKVQWAGAGPSSDGTLQSKQTSVEIIKKHLIQWINGVKNRNLLTQLVQGGPTRLLDKSESS